MQCSLRKHHSPLHHCSHHILPRHHMGGLPPASAPHPGPARQSAMSCAWQPRAVGTVVQGPREPRPSAL
ncbi:hypothetical protein V5799_025392 [Amblyomma americanum]|uniref:Uncharacterized protein n=1 Tax=Amblyomma americanum TaxID=6943 RepID=A0AAQ4E9I5_AMBAM